MCHLTSQGDTRSARAEAKGSDVWGRGRERLAGAWDVEVGLALMVGDRAASKSELARRPPPHCPTLTLVSQVLLPPSLLPGQPGPSLTAASPSPKPAPFPRAAQVSFKTQTEHVHLQRTQCYVTDISEKPKLRQITSPLPQTLQGAPSLNKPRLLWPLRVCPWTPAPAASAPLLPAGPLHLPMADPPQVSAPTRCSVLTGAALTTLTRAMLSMVSAWGTLGRSLSAGPAVMTAAPRDTPR